MQHEYLPILVKVIIDSGSSDQHLNLKIGFSGCVLLRKTLPDLRVQVFQVLLESVSLILPPN